MMSEYDKAQVGRLRSGRTVARGLDCGLWMVIVTKGMGQWRDGVCVCGQTARKVKVQPATRSSESSYVRRRPKNKCRGFTVIARFT